MKIKLNDKVYNALKWIALIALPALEVFWVALGKTWGWPYVGEIAATIAALAVLIGSLIGVSTYNYNKEVE